MKKTLSFALILTVFVVASAVSSEENARETPLSNTYKLDENKASAYKLNGNDELTQGSSVILSESPVVNEAADSEKSPRIITEIIPDGKIEKLIDSEGRVIAEKRIEHGQITKKILNYYYPTGQLSRQVTAHEDNGGFYAEDYYQNGKLAVQATYINEENKIGKEKKYDTNGTLRQEIPWIMSKEETEKDSAVRKTARHGNIITYYPDGKIAASFSVGANGKTIFFNRIGRPIKEITDSQILNFTKELDETDCSRAAIKLNLEELLELYEDEGDISYNKCGLPYRENFIYEIKETQGKNDTVTSFDETGMIRRITQYRDGKKEGVEQKFDASGNLTAEINYKNGIKDGYATGYFPTREIAFRKRYENGVVVGKLTCYFPTGEVAAEIAYKDGLKDGKAVINSPIKKELDFSKGKMLNLPAVSERREIISNLSALSTPDKECLNLENKVEELLLDIDVNVNSIKSSFAMPQPQECENFSAFKSETSSYICYDSAKKMRALYPTALNRGKYAVEKIFTPEGLLLYEIPYLEKKRQGWAKKYDENRKIIGETYFNAGELSSSRTYYPKGTIKEIMEQADGAPRQLIAGYKENGNLEFSITYNKDEKQEAYLNKDNKKDVYIHFYKNMPETIRESNAQNPSNFIEYSLALGEYTVYQDNELIKGGKICGYTVAPDVDVITHQKLQTEIESMQQAHEAEDITSTSEVKTGDVPEAENPASKIKPDISAKQDTTTPTSGKKEDLSDFSNLPEPPVLSADMAPIVDDLEPLTDEEIAGFDENVPDYKVKNALIPTQEEKRQAELAALNIGPVARPELSEFTGAVQKQKVETSQAKEENSIMPAKTEKLYYPNGNLRKTIKTRGTRTEEVKEYSKTGLLLTDTVYNKDKIVIEKYFGSGEVRRKTEKSYDDNVVMAFVSREDFYDSGKPRYEIRRLPEMLLFTEKNYYPDGSLKSQTEQKTPLSLFTQEYASGGTLQKQFEKIGSNVLVKEFDKSGNVEKMLLNGKEMPVSMAKNSISLLKDNSKIYDKSGVLAGDITVGKNNISLREFYKNGNVKTEILFYDNGEVSVKVYGKDKSLEKFAYLAPDGKLYIEKPVRRIIPSYRERYWVEYNNPRWVENQEKYSVNFIYELYLDTAVRILAELQQEVPEIVKKSYTPNYNLTKNKIKP